MSAKSTSSEDDNSGQVVAVQGSLLVSNMHKIGLSTDKSSKLRLLLASQSPRRREILDMMGLAGRYTAEPSPLNEEELQVELANKNFSPHDYARTLAERKAHAAIVMQSSNNDGEVTLIIGSDTIVDLNGLISKLCYIFGICTILNSIYCGIIFVLSLRISPWYQTNNSGKAKR